MHLYRKVFTGIAALVLAGFASFSQAALISVAPTPYAKGVVGDSIFVDLVFDGTGTTTEYIGGYDMDVVWNASVLSLTDVVFDPEDGMGDTFDIADDFGGIFGPLVNLFSLSFEPDTDLIAIQDGLSNNFVLATLEFAAIGNGWSDIQLFEFGGFTDEAGGILDVTLVDGRAKIPEPGMIQLMGLSLLALAVVRRRRR